MKVTLVTLSLLISLYLLYPVPGFVSPPAESLMSFEPADTESPFRRAFFTTLTRDQIMSYYKSAWRKPFLRLDHPPEFAKEYIRDQTRSSWLEELVHPGKDSLYINGFYPTLPHDQINFAGVHYLGKIIVRYIPSHPLTRLTVLALTAIAIYFFVREYVQV